MGLDVFKPSEGSVKDRTRKGRGNASGKGGESGRGHKGQRSRAGFSQRAGFEGGQMPLYRRIPKKRGWNNTGFKTIYFCVNVGDLEKYAVEGVFSPSVLEETNVVRPGTLVKVLGNGEIRGALSIKAHKVTAGAKKQIEASKSSLEII